MFDIIKHFADQGKTATEIAQITQISRSTVYYNLRKIKDPDYHNKTPGRHKKITQDDSDKIVKYIEDNPRCTLQEIIDACELEVSVATISRHLSAIGVTRKKASHRNSKRDTPEYQERCKEFLEEIFSFIDDDMHGDIVSIDECGVTTNLSRDYGWSFSGERVYVSDDFNTHKRTSLIGAVGYEGERLISYVEGGVKADDFVAFLDELFKVLPDGSCILMDNASIHTSRKVKEFCSNYPAIHVIYLPPYTPEYNPIELVWSQLKNHLRNINLKKEDQNKLTLECDKIISEMEKQFFQNCFSHSINIMKEDYKSF